MSEFNKKVVRLGTLTVTLAIIANFVPVLYLWLVEGLIPTGEQLVTIYSTVFAAFAISWVVQPLSYYGGFGMVGTYISWVAGSAADVRLPAISMAHKVTETEANTPEGDAIGAMGVATSVFVTVAIVSLFSLVGSVVIPMLPKVITDSFTYMHPALFAAVYTNMAVKDLKVGGSILAIGIFCRAFLPTIGVPSAWLTLIIVVLGMVCAGGLQKSKTKKEESKNV